MNKPRLRTSEPDEELLRWLSCDAKRDYRQCDWLLTDFEDDTWSLLTDGHSSRIDWRVALDDGSLLTAPKNQPLLHVFKYWLCIQGHPESASGGILAPSSVRARLRTVLCLIDYFLLHAHYFQLGDFGLTLVTASDIKNLLTTISSASRAEQSIYDIEHKLREHLRKKARDLSDQEVEQAIEEQPSIEELHTPEFERILFVDIDELIRVRAYLYISGHYGPKTIKSEFRYFSNFDRLLMDIYPNTIWAQFTIKFRPDELMLSPYQWTLREYPGVPVTNRENARPTRKVVVKWGHGISSLGLLAQVNLPIPTNALTEFETQDFIDNLQLTSTGRFKTLPSELCMSALRNSIDFALEYGDAILVSYINMALAARRSNMSFPNFLSSYPISDFLEPELKSLGIKVWDAAYSMGLIGRSLHNQKYRNPDLTKEYFERVRKNEGFFELIQVLFGSIEVCVGLLSTRRISELMALAPGKALDSSRTHLLFHNMKTGFYGMRDQIARPIPPIVEIFFKKLEWFQRELCKWGLIGSTPYLFSQPKRQSFGMGMSNRAFNSAIDMFCDYFNLPLDHDGRRFYIRQHQLRRAFAMLFFWNKSYSGLSTLSWIFGHDDPETIYRYVTESTPGHVLSWEKAAYGVQSLNEENAASEELSDLIEAHFGTRIFSVLDPEELQEYIYTLLEEGEVTIEPHFFRTSDGKDYEIITKVRRSSHENRSSP